jgi:hypothetical protein
LAETHALAVEQHCCFNGQSTAAEKWVGQEVAITAVLPLLPENPRYPKYGDCPLLFVVTAVRTSNPTGFKLIARVRGNTRIMQVPHNTFHDNQPKKSKYNGINITYITYILVH